MILNITQQQALREFNQYNFYLRKCEANAIFYQRLVSWDAVKLSRMFMIDRVPDVLPPLVKLSGLDRKYLATNLRYGAINKDSLIGQVLFADSKETLPKCRLPTCLAALHKAYCLEGERRSSQIAVPVFPDWLHTRLD